MTTKIIKTEEAYRKAINQAELLAARDPEIGSKEAELLELLALLIEDFERKNFKFDVPDPISAIEFRMEEQGLRQRDLIPILGSRSRVSEVLARKRPLTIPMIRSLSESLGIPTEILIRPIETSNVIESDHLETNWSKFPLQEMQKRGWINTKKKSTAKEIEDAVRDFLINVGKIPETAPLFRRRLKGLGVESFEDKAMYSTLAWTARVLQIANLHHKAENKFQIKYITEEFLRELALFSQKHDGPKRALHQLKEIGVRVVVEPGLPGTLVDGAALLDQEMQPVIALTLRFDRVDYFWFTLMHEIAHVWKHLNHPSETYIDRIDASDDNERHEKEANRIARDALIPRSIWNRSIARLNPTTETITTFAEDIGIHPAIVAGRIRYETGSFNRFSKLLGQGSVRKLFNEVDFK